MGLVEGVIGLWYHGTREGWYLVQHCANEVEPGTKDRGTGTKLI